MYRKNRVYGLAGRLIRQTDRIDGVKSYPKKISSLQDEITAIRIAVPSHYRIMNLESPYRPPQEIEAGSYSTLPGESGASQYTPDERQTVVKLAKYLRELGGFLIFIAILLGLILAFTLSMTFRLIGLLDLSFEAIAYCLNLFGQLATIVFLVSIGICMRRAAVPLQRSVNSMDDPMAQIMRSMLNFSHLYAWKIGFVTIGILILLVTKSLKLAFSV